TVVSATAVVAGAVIACEKMANPSSPGSAVSQLAVSPKVVTLQQDQLQDFLAVDFTPTGDTAQISVTRSVTGGTPAATTSQGGRLDTGVALASATITAASEGQSGTAAITVTRVPVASVTVSPATANLQQGQTRQLTATPQDASGNALSGRVVTWASGNTAVATVSGSGLVSGVAAGSAAITATSEGKSGSASVTVTPVGATVTLVGAGDIAEGGGATGD